MSPVLGDPNDLPDVLAFTIPHLPSFFAQNAELMVSAALNGIETCVLLFPNEEWSNKATDAALNPVVHQLSPNISFAQQVDDNLQTLSAHNADKDGTISGFLYVPDLDKGDSCANLSKRYVPTNVTRRANLPPTDFTLVALAPWINPQCTHEYLASAAVDPTRAFLFYLPNDTCPETPSASSTTWDLGDRGAWKNRYNFPIYAIHRSLGMSLIHQLSLYSGNLTNVPYGHDISALAGVDPRDYVRLYSQLTVSQQTSLPSFWVFLVVVVVVLAAVLAATSASMHLIQRRRRKSLQRRVESGEVNLEALGIKRLTVPPVFVERLPIFTYNSEGERSLPASPLLYNKPTSPIESSKLTHNTIPSPKANRISTPKTPTVVYVQDDGVSNSESMLIHKFLPYSQPTCAICLENFESGISEIRELPCGHIFHPECIDPFLANNSSLCPLCKHSALPIGYCPTKITNAMVWRERNLRNIRSQITVEEDSYDESRKSRHRLSSLGSKIKRSLSGPLADSQVPAQREPMFLPNALPLRRMSMGRIGTGASREEVVERRIRELTASQRLIQDPDIINDRPKPPWRRTLARIFPGF